MPEPGEAIGPYRLVSQLGKGAMGEVWRARDERLDRFVALKVLPPEAADDQDRRVRMLREARAAAAIRHANVVTLFDIVEQDGDDILVMELVEGRTLSDVIRRDGPPAVEVALRWIEGIADALVAAHARGILHRDIKAANVMITHDGGVKVLDFGLAKLRDSGPRISGGPVRIPDGKIALDETMPSAPYSTGHEPTLAPGLDPVSYQTHVGSLLGTPIYMAPEQLAGATPDERSEVFSVGVVAYELLAGKPPYTATAMDELFRQIATREAPPLAKLPAPLSAIVLRALAKAPDERWQSMAALRDAVAAERRALFAPRARRWPLAAAAAVLVVGGAAGAWWLHATRDKAPRPGDEYVQRALEEYDVFYNEKALSSLRAALAVAPDHPRANAYVILLGGSADDQAAAIKAAHRARAATGEHTKDRALIDTALALVERGPAAARATLRSSGADLDRDLAFWAAELAYRAGDYTAARDEYQALLAEPAEQFRGRIYDHDSAVLLYLDEPDEALRIGKLYRDAFPGEPDAVAVYATTLAAAGRLDEATTAAEEAVRLSEGEDTLAGLAKVRALAGDRARARELYQRSLDKAGPARRPLRRAALAFLEWIDGDTEAAQATVAPCLSGDDAGARERGPCLFVAGVIDPAHADVIAQALDLLASQATGTNPAYGAPDSLAALVRARAKFFGGGCVTERDLLPPTGGPSEEAYAVPLDFFAAYHIPLFSTWALCERAALRAAYGRRVDAAALLEPAANRAPGRTWLLQALARYR